MIKLPRHPVLATSLVTALSACAVGSGTETDEPIVLQAIEPARACQRPFRAALMQDKSRSGQAMRTPQLRSTDLDPMLDQILQCGGEIAVGLIETNSNQPLVRVHVPDPPRPPNQPELSANPWFAAQEKAEFDRLVESYGKAHNAHLFDSTDRIERFRVLVDSLLARKADARRTDIWGGFNRAAYFLAEPGDWSQAPRLVVILISDALDNQDAASVGMPPGAVLYLVNGEPSLGALEDLQPIRFEAIAPAIRHALSNAR